VIGLTVVALGTSAPELVVSIKAALSGVPDIAVGNVVGSNIANILLVLGLPALIYPVACECDGPIRRNGLFMVGASAIFIGLGWSGRYEFWHGALLLGLLVMFLFFSYWQARRYGDQSMIALTEELEGDLPKSPVRALIYCLVGIAALPIGSKLLVDGAVDIAHTAGLSEAVVGLTLVALGTSLPELATSLMAALHREDDVAIGNVVGSNLFNILGIMGVTAMLTPVPVAKQILHFDMFVMLGVAVLLLVFAIRRQVIGRVIGVFCFGGYVAYVVAQFNGFSGIATHAAAM
jgi:cation:H+ antiporter